MRHTCDTEVDYGEGKKVTNSKVSGIITNNDKLNIQMKDPFWTPVPEEPLYFIVGNNLVYPTKGKFKVLKSNLSYIKNTPRMQLGSQYSIPTIDVDCPISSTFVQHQIINQTVNMILENIESPRYQSNLNELHKSN